MNGPVEKVCIAAADAESARFQLDNSTADLNDLVVEALRAGVPATDLAGVSGLSVREIRRIRRLNGSAAPREGHAPGVRASGTG